MEISSCLVSGTSLIFSFRGHLPPQKWNLPRLLPVCPKSGREIIFLYGFLTFRWPIFAPNLLNLLGIDVLIMMNMNMQVISPKRVPVKIAAQSSVENFKISKWQNFTKTCPHLAQGSFISFFDELVRPQPRFLAFHAPFCFSRLSSTLPLTSLSLYCIFCFRSYSDRPCDEASSFLYWPSQVAFQGECWPFQAKFPSHSQSLSQWRSSWPLPSFPFICSP